MHMKSAPNWAGGTTKFDIHTLGHLSYKSCTFCIEYVTSALLGKIPPDPLKYSVKSLQI